MGNQRRGGAAPASRERRGRRRNQLLTLPRITPFGSSRVSAFRAAAVLVFSIGFASGLSGCATGQFDSGGGSAVDLPQQPPTSQTSPVPSAAAPLKSPRATLPTPESAPQPLPHNASQPLPQNDPAPVQSVDPVIADPPAVTLLVPNGLYFNSPIESLPVWANVTSSVGVAYVKLVLAGPKGQIPMAAILSTGTPQHGSWTSTYLVPCSEFPPGSSLSVFAEAGDLNGTVADSPPIVRGVTYGGVSQPYDPSTNTKGSTANFQCPG